MVVLTLQPCDLRPCWRFLGRFVGRERPRSGRRLREECCSLAESKASSPVERGGKTVQWAGGRTRSLEKKQKERDIKEDIGL